MRKYLLFLFVMMVAASCGTAPPEETDWCWTFDFRTSDNTFSISSGAQVNNYGLYSGAGVLSFSYQHPTFVEPVLAAITVVRPDGITGDIPISAIGTVFGSSASFSVTMPSTSNRETRWFQPTTEGNAGTDVNVTIDVGSQEIIIESIRIEGNGETPFDYNQCTDPEEGPTFTPTQTNTPTETPTPTDTPTPTATQTHTPEPGGSCTTYDFTIDEQGWTGWLSGGAYDPLGIYTAGVGWGANPSGIRGQTNIEIGWSGYVDTVEVWIDNVMNAVYGAGNFVINIDELGWVVQPGTGMTYYSHSVNDYVTTKIVTGLNWHSSISLPLSHHHIEMIRVCSSLPTQTPTTTVTPLSLPTNTPFNFQPTVDLTQITSTPSITPSPTSTDYPQSTTVPHELTLTVGANTPTYSVEEIRENEAEWELLQEQQESNNAIQNLLQDILDAINDGNNSGSGDGGEAGGESGTGEGDTIVGGVSDWYSTISDSLYTIQGLFGRVSLYFGQAANAANSLVTAFYTAPPTPIPGLPQCMSAPLEHDICAIYYILDWTLFAPNTLGQFIVPLIWAIMNVIIIFRVLGYVLKLIKRTEDVTR